MSGSGLARQRTPAVQTDPFAGYRGKPGTFDELLGMDGKVREPWRCFVANYAQLGRHGQDEARASAIRVMRDDGAAFNVYADPDDRAFAWRLHTVPMLMAEDEWAVIERAVKQRARIISAALRDLYGQRRLLTSGVLPPDIVLGTDRFVHAMAGEEVFQRAPMMSYAVDLARDASGRWVVLGDQTEAPSGIGYALANRIAMSHGFGSLFRRCGVQRVVGYFSRLRDGLIQTIGRDDGRIVMLANDTDQAAYFGNAYIARYLGYTLAESADFTVRDERLYLKTLDGLQRIDLILRHIDSFACDPLEVPGTTGLGVPGLVRAVKSGTVILSNALGAGIAQNRALAPFMPQLAQALEAEDLVMPDAPCLWLGDPASRARVFEEPERWRIASAVARNDPGEAADATDWQNLDQAARAALRARMERHGHRYVAQAPVELATIPGIGVAGLEPMHAAMRVFATVTPAGDWEVMPGALLRYAGESRTIGLPNGFGAGDLWVLTDESSIEQGSILQTTLSGAHLRRTGRDLLSRTADNLFWLGRYAERAETIIRATRSVLVRLIEPERPGGHPAILWRLLRIIERRGRIERFETDVPADGGDVEERLARVLFDAELGNGLRETLSDVHRTATLVRDQISHDAWRLLAALHLDRAWRDRPAQMIDWDTAELLETGLRQLSAFAGTEAENMTHNYAWRFIEMGRRIERAVNVVDLLRGLVLGNDQIEATGVLPLLLELGDSSMTYRSRYLARPLLVPVIDLLLLDETNPRAVAYQLERVVEHMDHMPKDDATAQRATDRRLALKMASELRLAEIDQLAEAGRALPALNSTLGLLAQGLPDLSHLISRTYFAHIERVLTTPMRARGRRS